MPHDSISLKERRLPRTPSFLSGIERGFSKASSSSLPHPSSAMISFAFHLLFVSLVLSSLSSKALAASDGYSLSLGSSLSLNQSIISADGMFQFGFFSLNSSSSMYLGVTYADRTPLTTVWIANREKAVSSAAICTFTTEGLVNLTDNGEIVWSIGQRELNASTLMLQNTSNLVLQSSNLSKIWQSFDNPGNTWLPGMTLGPNQKLQCWLTDTNPAGGSYSLIMGELDNFISVYNGTTQYWDSGRWDNKSNIFSNVPDMTNAYIYTFTFSSSAGFTYYVKANESASFNISKFVIRSNGQIIESSYDPSHLQWNDFWFKPAFPCTVTRLCGQNSICDNGNQPACECPAEGFRPVNQLEWDTQAFFHGCERKSPFNCSATHGSNDGFLSINETTFHWNFTTTIALANLQECKSMCLANCSCNGFFFDGDGAGNCSLFTDNLYDGTVSSSPVTGFFYLRVAAIDLASNEASSKKKTSIGLIIGATVGGIASLVMVTLAVLLVIKRRKLAAAAKTPEAGLRAFSYAELQAATKNFKERLGSGGFGTVYRGVVGGGGGGGGGGSGSGAASLAVAVKKLHRLDEGEKQFRAEVRTIGTVQHVNLVRLIGFCSEGKHRLLVYELAENGSLDGALFKDHARAASLSWPLRFNIALGTARGVAYLHESCRECIIHCDIKPENILLDSSSFAKVSDFGLAKLVGRQFSHVLTTLRGTRGYLAPEWIAGLPITAKADVYSYGMTILELLSGHRNISNDGPDTASTISDSDFFPIWAAQLIHQPEANLSYLLDPRLEGHANMEEVQRLAYCAIWCIQDNEDSRPVMGKIVQMLEGTLPVSIPPIPTSLQCLLGADSFNSKSSPLFSQD